MDSDNIVGERRPPSALITTGGEGQSQMERKKKLSSQSLYVNTSQPVNDSVRIHIEGMHKILAGYLSAF